QLSYWHSPNRSTLAESRQEVHTPAISHVRHWLSHTAMPHRHRHRHTHTHTHTHTHIPERRSLTTHIHNPRFVHTLSISRRRTFPSQTYTHTHTYTSTHTHTHTDTHTSMHTHTHTHTQAHVRTRTHTHTHTQRACGNDSIHTCKIN